MYCGNCGMELNNNAVFCSNCGQRVVNNNARPQNPYRPVNQPQNTYNQYQVPTGYQQVVPKATHKSPFLLTMGIIAMLIATYELIEVFILMVTAMDTFTFITFFSLWTGTSALICGIYSIRFWNKPSHMDSCIRWGVAWIVFYSLTQFATIVTLAEYLDSSALVSTWISLSFLSGLFNLLPAILYIVAAAVYRKTSYSSSKHKLNQIMNESAMQKFNAMNNGSRPGM